MVHAVLAEELAGPVHALSLKALAAGRSLRAAISSALGAPTSIPSAPVPGPWTAGWPRQSDARWKRGVWWPGLAPSAKGGSIVGALAAVQSRSERAAPDRWRERAFAAPASPGRCPEGRPRRSRWRKSSARLGSARRRPGRTPAVRPGSRPTTPRRCRPPREPEPGPPPVRARGRRPRSRNPPAYPPPAWRSWLRPRPRAPGAQGRFFVHIVHSPPRASPS